MNLFLLLTSLSLRLFLQLSTSIVSFLMLQESMNPIPVPFILTISLQQLHSILLQLFLITVRVLMSIYLLILFRPI